MNTRRGIIAVLLGILPALGQQLGSKTARPPAKNTGQPVTLTYQAGSEASAFFSVSWDTAKAELVVQADKREARISAKALMDALGAK